MENNTATLSRVSENFIRKARGDQQAKINQRNT